MDVLELEDHLEHYGILGMKWGIRRYQNKDGSLTALGRKRYLNDDGSYNETAKKEIPKTALSDDELRTRINRLDMEKRYDQLTASEQSRFKRLLSKALDNLVDSGSRLISDTIINKITEHFKDDTIEDLDADELYELMKQSSKKGKDTELNMRDAKKLANYVKSLKSIERYVNGGKDDKDKDDDD